jgi:regulator of RNase E activity RraA
MADVSGETIDRLAAFDSPTICNVIELFDVRSRTDGILSPQIRALSPNLPPMVGRAVTLTFRSGKSPGADEKPIQLFACQQRFETVPSPRVLVIQDLDDPAFGAVNGEIVCRLASAYGCVGLVTNGYARDVQAVSAMAFPCFAKGLAVSHGYGRFLAINEPVNVGGLPIRPGDILHGDANGVTTIPVDIAEAVARHTPAYIEAERLLLSDCQRRPLDDGLLDGALRKFRQQIATLITKIRGGEGDEDPTAQP